MEERNNRDVYTSLILALIVLAFVLWMVMPATPHYKIGKCYVHYENSGETWDKGEYSVYKVLAVGKKNYKVCSNSSYGCKLDVTGAWLFQRFEDWFSKETQCAGDK